jgi:hypothetical protein
MSCVSATVCVAVGSQGSPSTGVIVTDAVSSGPPSVSSVSFSGSGYNVKITVHGFHFGGWQPSASPIYPPVCTPGPPAGYDYPAGVLGFADTTAGSSAGNPGDCIGIVIRSWSDTKAVFTLDSAYVWPLMATGDAYQLTFLGLTIGGKVPTIAAIPPPAVTSVLVTGTGQASSPTVTVNGTHFGSRAAIPIQSPACVSNDRSGIYATQGLAFDDSSQGWQAGQGGDCLGLTVKKWTPSQVVFTFGPFYPQVGALALGDSIHVGVLSASWDGNARATLPPTISSLTVTGKPSAPIVTVTGTGFGVSAPSPQPSTPVSCVAGDTSYTYPAGTLAFTDTNGSWTAGETGDCIGLIINMWSDTKVVFTFGKDYSNVAQVKAGDSVQVTVEGTMKSATAGA